MADISHLGSLAPVEQLDLENYADQKVGFQLPKAGIYILQAPSEFPSTAFGVSKSGALTVQVDPTIVAGEHEGFKVKFQRLSAKTYQRAGATVSKVGDYLRACGVKMPVRNAQEIANAVEATANVRYQAELDWSAYSKTTGKRLEGMKNFPTDGKGGFLSYFEDADALNDEGNPTRVRANLVITRFIPASA